MLEQAELYAALFALHVGCYMRLPYVVVGTDNGVSRSQILGMKGGIFCDHSNICFVSCFGCVVGVTAIWVFFESALMSPLQTPLVG